MPELNLNEILTILVGAGIAWLVKTTMKNASDLDHAFSAIRELKEKLKEK